MQTEKCCAHCPGKLVSPGRNESHDCCLPKYVSGNLKVSSLTRHAPPEYPERPTTEKDSPKSLAEERPSCYDHFALAKRLHAENLEHQPLPDKVDDSVFKDVGLEKCCRRASSGRRCSCCQHESEDSRKRLARRYGPALGCKQPKTKMDLAICWETPLDPTYEPRRSTHIDGSEGGLAPAIFTLVQHTSNARASVRSAPVQNEESRQGRRKVEENSNHCGREGKEESHGSARSGCCCECLCKGLSKIDISKKDEDRAKRIASFRKCVACEPRNTEGDPRLIKSAVGLALGLEKQEHRRNDPKVSVPRPRTPFARRSFCINSLSPPFSVVNGYRGADYPEHWRLMTVYQQSYKNPYRRRNCYR